MHLGSIIRTAVYITLSGIFITSILWYALVHLGPHTLWIEILALLLYGITMLIVVVVLLRHFFFQQFHSLHQLVNGGQLTEKELGRQDILSNIKKAVMEWSLTKASEIDQLKQMEKYRKEFVGNVSHELKTPIFNIQGYILTLLDGGLEDRSVNRLYLERSERSINRMIHIVEDLESIARLESGELQLKPDFFEMQRLIAEVFEMQEMLAREAKVKLTSGQKQTCWVYADRKRILEVMNNLVVNSIKYGRKHGTTNVSFVAADDQILISVSDTGIGIAENDQKRIFERFYRCDKGRSREQGGTGLGLSIVKHIIEAHGQNISVQSTLGKGTTFTFSLPVVS